MSPPQTETKQTEVPSIFSFVQTQTLSSSPPSFSLSLSLKRIASMYSLPSQAMRPLSLSPCLTRSSYLRFRILSSLSLPPIFHNSQTRLSFSKNYTRPHLFIRNCTSITAKPSSEFNRNRTQDAPDEKLRALRELFSRPGVNIDAYIIPSQDAHQV